MDRQQKADSSRTIYLKVVVAVLPATLVSRSDLPHKHILYSSSLIAGALLAGLVPPRKGFVPMLVVTIIIALIYLRFFT